jgi:hypothetical protein
MVLLIDAGIFVGTVLRPNHTCKDSCGHPARPRRGRDAAHLRRLGAGPRLLCEAATGRHGQARRAGLRHRAPAAAERDAWYVDDTAGLADRLDVAQPVYCAVRDHETAGKLLPGLGPGVQEIVWNKRRSILGNAAAAALTPPRRRVGSAPDGGSR